MKTFLIILIIIELALITNGLLDLDYTDLSWQNNGKKYLPLIGNSAVLFGVAVELWRRMRKPTL